MNMPKENRGTVPLAVQGRSGETSARYSTDGDGEELPHRPCSDAGGSGAGDDHDRTQSPPAPMMRRDTEHLGESSSPSPTASYSATRWVISRSATPVRIKNRRHPPFALRRRRLPGAWSRQGDIPCRLPEMSGRWGKAASCREGRTPAAVREERGFFLSGYYSGDTICQHRHSGEGRNPE